MLDDSKTRYTKPEIEAIIAREKFVYQKVELPFGLETGGPTNRRATAQKIFPASLAGRSVLDVGCCYGLFLYEAEALGATRLVGTEKNPERLRQAELIRDLRGASLELSSDDFENVCATESFDVVLLLNVIHHLLDPIDALRTLARAARELFVVEFPTPNDPKYGTLLRAGLTRGLRSRAVAQVLNDLPIIGVSSLSKNGQTYVFTEKSIRAILLELEPLVAKIDFLSSPKSGRVIALCRK